MARQALFGMAKSKSTTGPMRTQPGERTSIVPTQVLPEMPNTRNTARAAPPKQEPTRNDAVRAAKARISRRNSLHKQREALKAGNPPDET
jgi:hypothetical protein